VIVTNHTPEMERLRAYLRIEWDPFRAWIDCNLDRVNAIGDLAELDGEEAAPVIRAQFVFERWMQSRAAGVAPRQPRDPGRNWTRIGWSLLTVAAALLLVG